jgi:hypothetical protein
MRSSQAFQMIPDDEMVGQVVVRLGSDPTAL